MKTASPHGFVYDYLSVAAALKNGLSVWVLVGAEKWAKAEYFSFSDSNPVYYVGSESPKE